jgi:hypothetical protein
LLLVVVVDTPQQRECVKKPQETGREDGANQRKIILHKLTVTFKINYVLSTYKTALSPHNCRGQERR